MTCGVSSGTGGRRLLPWIGLPYRFADWTECCSKPWLGRSKSAVLPGVVGLKGGAKLIDVCAMGANALVELVAGDAELF